MTERHQIIENHKKFLIEEQKRELAENSVLIKNFLLHCKRKGILISEIDIEYIQTIGIVATYPNIVSLLNNKIQPDKEELVSFKVLESEFTQKQFASGYLISEMFMAMANSYFRRNHYEKNAFAPRFIELYWNYNSEENEKYISLDFNRVRINVDNRMLLELDTWYGAKYNQNISEIQDGIVKLIPPIGFDELDIEFLFGNVHSLNIKWYTKDNIKIFQAEEFKNIKSKIIKNGTEYFPAKYIHAEYDLRSGIFRHFDGAIHFYTENEYLQRRETDFNHNKKNDLQIKTLSQKLFKVNGKIQINDWVELTSHFLVGNPLIFEYFEGKLPDRIIEIINVLRNKK